MMAMYHFGVPSELILTGVRLAAELEDCGTPGALGDL